MIDLAHLCLAWGLPPVLSTWTPETGTVHRTMLLTTVRGNYALRVYRYREGERWRIESEHAVSTYVRECHLPAIAPLHLLTGGTILEHAGTFYALFPWAPGQQIKRTALADTHVATLGAFLAQLHQVLHGYPQERVPPFSFTVDHTMTLARIDEIEAVIRSRSHMDDVDRQALTRLLQRRAWLTTVSPVSVESLSVLEHQVIHGDYQETNLFFAEGEISAIIDWDWTFPAPRAWEVVRVLHYLFGFDVAASCTFLKAYRSVLPLPRADLERAAAVYAWIREHDLWVFEELYLQGNQRVRVFVKPGNFVPLTQRWTRLQGEFT